MAFMEWSSELSVGLDSVDDQHKWLLDATNRLHDALNQPQTDRAAVAEILEGLMDYTMNHFIMEEELFERFDYPQAARHKAMHDLFTRTVMLGNSVSGIRSTGSRVSEMPPSSTMTKLIMNIVTGR